MTDTVLFFFFFGRTVCDHEIPIRHVLQNILLQRCHTRGTRISVYQITYAYVPTSIDTFHNQNLRIQQVRPWSNILNRSAILCPWSQPFRCCSPHLLNLLFAAYSANPGRLPWPVLSTKKQATHYLAAHPHGEIPITVTFSMQHAFRGWLDFLKFIRVFFNYHIF